LNERSTPKPFSFGATCELSATRDEWRGLCRMIDDSGCSTLLVSDHFGDQLALVPALAAAIEATSRVRIGALVACNDYRHPVMYAKELATLDVMSDGRIDWGIGAGWLRSEYERVGITFDDGAERAERLFEAVAVMKRCFADEPFTFDGAHYRISQLDGRPKPVQHPHPRLLVAGSARRVLSFAGEQADIVGVAPSLLSRSIGRTPPRCSVEAAIDRQVEWISAVAAKRQPTPTLNMVAFPAIVTNDRLAKARQVAPALGYEPDEVLRSPHAWIGTVEQICESLEQWRERWGVSYWAVPARALPAVTPVIDRLAGR
jgi:probable F420-dependent oxidoreductase